MAPGSSYVLAVARAAAEEALCGETVTLAVNAGPRLHDPGDQ